ncbi:6640_t:CDS:1, partial [Entrophospora sp. SA101]
NEWAIHCGSTLNIEVALGEHWSNMAENLPPFAVFQIAFGYMWLPISSCSAEQSFSKYNF